MTGAIRGKRRESVWGILDYCSTGKPNGKKREKKMGNTQFCLEGKRKDGEEGAEQWDSLEINKEEFLLICEDTEEK